MKFHKTIIIGLYFIVTLTALGQGRDKDKDSIDLDLKNLTEIDFYKKHSFDKEFSSGTDLTMTKRIWSTKHLRKIDKEIRIKGVKTFTVIDQRPSKDNKYYIIGHYQLPTDDHLMRMSFYRLDPKSGTIEYQGLDDLTEDKWTRIE
jgi:hypothetical protein